MSGKLEDCTFIGNLKGYKGVILFPALGSPALIKQGDALTAIIAIDEDSFKLYTDEGGAGTAEAEIPKSVLIKLHSQLILANWKERGASAYDYASYVREFTTETSKRNTSLGSEENVLDCVETANTDKIEGFYLGKITGEKDFFVNIKNKDGIYPSPFGTLNQGAVKMYNNAGYIHLFQINISSSLNLAHNGLKELLFLYLDYGAYSKDGDENNRQKYLTNPSDELLATYYQEKIKLDATDSAKLNGETTKYERPQGFDEKELEIPKLLNTELDNEKLFYTEYKHLLLSRHPVYISDKIALDIGTISDLHISARQTIFKKISPQVIPGASEDDSPFLGTLDNEAAVAAKGILDKLDTDIILAAGDIFDVARNLSPSLLEKKVGSKNLRTGQMWDYFDFETNKSLYPWWPDFLLFLSFIHNSYNTKGKPIFFINGNHEGWSEPYGLSPRVGLDIRKGKKTEVSDDPDGEPIPESKTEHIRLKLFKGNPGVAADHNFTFYEATLLFGRTYDKTGPASNFKYWKMDWLHQMLSPWQDCIVNYGQEQNFLFLGWGAEEKKIMLVAEKFEMDILPRASGAVNDNQLTLVKEIKKLKDNNSNAVNILCSHFTFVAYGLKYPLKLKGGLKRSGAEIKERNDVPMIGRGPSNTYETNSSDIGTFVKHRDDIYRYLANGNIDITISGHTHRAAVHYVSKDGWMLHSVFDRNQVAIKLNKCERSLKSVDLENLGLNNTAICLVNGASGLYSKQNIFNDKFYDFDSPMAMKLNFNDNGKPSKVSFPKYDLFKPRLAVRLDYLWIMNTLPPFKDMRYESNIFKHQVTNPHGGVPKMEPLYFILSPNSSQVQFNKEWLQFFNKDKINWLPYDLPIEYMSLHAVHKNEGQYVKMPYNLGFKTNVQAPHCYSLINKITGAIFTSKSLQDFVENLVYEFDDELPENDWMYFLSIKLRGIENLQEQYNVDSPWCYPVTINTSDNGFITRDLSRIEIPKYSDFEEIAEYKEDK